jgi:hypothetical protein
MKMFPPLRAITLGMIVVKVKRAEAYRKEEAGKGGEKGRIGTVASAAKHKYKNIYHNSVRII